MINLNNELQNNIIECFENNSIDYIFLPEHIEPKDKPEDMHFLIAESDFKLAGKVLESQGWFSWLDPDNGNLSKKAKIWKLVIRGMFNPIKGSEFLVTEKHRTPDVIENIAGSLRGQYKQHQLWNSGTRVNLHNHIAYKGSHTVDKIRIDPKVENAFFNHKIKKRGRVNLLDHPERLTHHICNGVFDLSGEFNQNKIELCDSLYNEIKNDVDRLERFHEHLSDIFYAASEVVYNCVNQKEYIGMRKKLHKYDEY